MFLPVLAVLSHSPLVPTGHFTFVASFACRTHFNGGVLKRCGCQCHLVSTLYRLMTVIHTVMLVINHSHLHTRRNKSVDLVCIFGILCQTIQVLTLRMSSTTSVWTSPCTGSPLTCVMRSPAHRPASWAGPPSSMCCRVQFKVDMRYKDSYAVCVYVPST